MEQQSKVFLVHFLKKWKYLDFCLPELESLAGMFGVKASNLYHEKNPKEMIDIKKSSCFYVNLPSEKVAQQIASRSILIHEFLHVFSQATHSYDDLVKNVDMAKLQPSIDKKMKFRFTIEGINKKVSREEQINIIEMFKKFPFDQELVDLKNYEVCYKILDNEPDGQLYFGERIAYCRDKDEETYYSKYDLKKRPYLGPTSTDHELAFLMANQGQIRPGDFVYDPFAGTGSIATALQHFQTFVHGSDLDIRVLKGYGVGRKTKNKIPGIEKIDKFDAFTNFKYYQIPQPDLWVQDITCPMVRTDRPIFDAIVCDPPYGVRARSQAVGVAEHKKDKYQQRKPDIPMHELNKLHDTGDDNKNFHAAVKQQISAVDIYQDLLNAASSILRPGGRIVFLYHNDDRKSDEENAFPKHPDFDFVSSSKDVLTKDRSRHLITMVRKIPGADLKGDEFQL